LTGASAESRYLGSYARLGCGWSRSPSTTAFPADENVEDVTWLRDTGEAGWVVFMKDGRIRRNPVERAALVAHRARAFCLTRMDLTAAQMASRFLDRLPAIVAACSKPGPFLYAVHAARIEPLDLAS
jgi:hypothetical protein